MAIQSNKKRKHEPSSQPSDNDDEKMSNDPNFESVLFDEMTQVNCQLISLANKVKQVDYHYFLNNSGMIDEFIGNIHEFLKQVDIHRKQVSFTRLSADSLSHIFQFLDTTTLKNHCGLVSKLWNQSVEGLKVRVRPLNVDNLLNSSLIKKVSSLKLVNPTANTFKSIAKSRNLVNLQTLDLSDHKLSKTAIGHVKKFQVPNLTELKLCKMKKFTEKEVAKELFHSKFMSNIKKLYLSHSFEGSSKSFIESISESKYMNQITHLNINNTYIDKYNKDTGIDKFLKDKINLEHLEMEFYRLSVHPNLLTSGNYKNLTYLNISNCFVSNQEFVDLILSPNLPKLTTLKAKRLNNFYWSNAQPTQAVEFPPNRQSSLTELDLGDLTLPKLFDHCPKLKKLSFSDFDDDDNNKEILNMMKSPNLSNLEYLDINHWKGMSENLFTNPIYSNLKELYLTPIHQVEPLDVNLVSNCTNLVNLAKLCIKSAHILTNDCLEEFNKNPTFVKLTNITLPTKLVTGSDDDYLDEDDDFF
ncbi:hypothetical protein NAEGRDRAFT_53287 [Naegleria gruberi]|uniref:F-box domain-containing protein n=1 Tax=Naegleria gruberi TaxID=5762 RepID=D2VYL0_NAEGR|nr:uncharacterized protein NAEGRDRAFT_53287 [Naegleria gruberi]EFC38075.1 hypothetical protein NAEGRDRAFT_53287 [Naegleria gruberi]|eukprot:XP_002670819.1 hypothetical protein NAEGRDRAFT_53287 [Naegleria gruberi strain NEG-M]